MKKLKIQKKKLSEIIDEYITEFKNILIKNSNFIIYIYVK